ncbi:hypothetical protein LSCM1_06097 [Leishmania martiniquensis]|uniref:Transmembrane protein n=1 Tax=Leishmania martiniquensis TaxID=1580590 RepID=A0A836HL85_9TRYP|nr:hypothetical protein LSCM1_06097 [Leishmania martiniquensis]
MKTHPRSNWCCVARLLPSPLLLFIALALMVVCAHTDFVTAQVKTSVWLSGPTEVWDAVLGTPGTQAAINEATQRDLQAAIETLDADAKADLTGLTSHAPQLNGPAYGANANFAVSTDKLSEEDVLAAVRSAAMTNIDNAFSTVGLSGSITALMADGPSSMISVGPVLLPLTGSTYFWYVLLQILSVGGKVAIALLLHPLQVDVQNAVDSTMTKFIIEAKQSEVIVNASSLYMAYNVWAYPGVEVKPSTSDDLKALAMRSKLSLFNTYLETVKSSSPEIQGYIDLFPNAVRPWTPPPGNPFDEDDFESETTFKVLANSTGDYLLLFNGEVEQWDAVWSKNREALAKSIERAANERLHRRTFVSSAHVVSAETVPADPNRPGGLRVLCRVLQGLTRFSDHPWSPEEMASLLLQADYSETQALYASGGSAAQGGVLMQARAAVAQPTLLAVSHGDSPGSIATATVKYNFSRTLSKETAGVIAMAALIIGLSFIIILVTVCCCCLCPNLTRSSVASKKSAPLRVRSDP